MTEAFIYDGLRSPFGRHGGSLAAIRPDDLLATVISALVRRNKFATDLYEDVIAGNTNQAGEDSRNLARHAALLSGLPTSVAGITVNRLCGSGLGAIADAARVVRCGEGQLLIAGGAESMSRAPLVISRASSAFDRGHTMEDSTLGARFPNPKITAQYGNDTMPQTADNVGRDLSITREQSDRFAGDSQKKYEAARAQGFFTEEILSIEVPSGRKGPPILVSADEHPRPGTDLASLAKLRPLAPDGVVTAGNASGVNDGAAAVLMGSAEIGTRYGVKPRARLLASAVAGVEPRTMGLGPVPAIRKVLARTGLKLSDMAVIEVNEAFATQVLGCLQQLELAFDDPRINPNGGAIAIGHPLGASGGRLLITAIRQLERIQARFALVSMCIGVGQGIAVVVERCG